MEHIIFITFFKSKSKNFDRIVTLAKTLPDYKEIDGMYTVQINTIKEYLFHYDTIIEIINTIKLWKKASVLLYDISYEKDVDYYNFQKKIEMNYDDYKIYLKNRSSIGIENLPMPIVFYPQLYGAFFAFADNIGDQIYFCECEKKAIINFLHLKEGNANDYYSEKQEYQLSKDFPQVVIEMSKKWGSNHYEHFHFKKGLCFKCNKIIPQKMYCLPMYGSQFKQHYGWYINQEYYKLGIDREDNALVLYNSLVKKIHTLPEESTPELCDLIQRINFLISKSKITENDHSEIEKLHNSIDRAIENSVREQFGFKKIGDAWVSETMLFNIVKELYPTEKIIRHYRPDWLEGLELDIYFPDLKLGLEYQGIQHFKAVEHWGGEAQLKKQQKNDARKKRICNELGVKLICINYNEPLSVEHISMRIAEEM